MKTGEFSQLVRVEAFGSTQCLVSSWLIALLSPLSSLHPLLFICQTVWVFIIYVFREPPTLRPSPGELYHLIHYKIPISPPPPLASLLTCSEWVPWLQFLESDNSFCVHHFVLIFSSSKSSISMDRTEEGGDCQQADWHYSLDFVIRWDHLTSSHSLLCLISL